ncbi:MAG TPA: exodeoxyribonuclease VII large subunit, partial [Flexilinea sp.]|nr:exodeoxyribonuclease VII large subunit [Flexilinea sp.]
MQNFDFFSFADFALSVSEVNQQVKDLLESDPVLEDISVKGEISNLSRPVSGHVYFTLKDEKSSLKCVMWRTVAAEFQELFKNGAAVIVHGRIGVYERDGLYQLYADAVYPVGRGKLFEEFLRLKEKLEKEGLFDSGRKKPLPYMPERIGVVTSSSGAAIQDIFNTIRKRWPLAEIYLSPASVQGEDAPAELIKAYKKLVEMNPDVILIARGGGSLE